MTLAPVSAFLGIATVLAVPGPTNLMLFGAGTENGLKNGWLFVAAEVLGYAIVVPLLYVVFGLLEHGVPVVNTTLHIMCGLILIFTAIKLWKRIGHIEGARRITFQDIMLITITNPKSLVIVALLPVGLVQEPIETLSAAFIVLACVAIMGMGWVSLGCLVKKGLFNQAGLQKIQRMCALLLVGFGCLMLSSAL